MQANLGATALLVLHSMFLDLPMQAYACTTALLALILDLPMQAYACTTTPLASYLFLPMQAYSCATTLLAIVLHVPMNTSVSTVEEVLEAAPVLLAAVGRGPYVFFAVDTYIAAVGTYEASLQ